MGWLTNEVNARYEASLRLQQELARQERAERQAARDNAAESERRTRDALRPQVWFRR